MKPSKSHRFSRRRFLATATAATSAALLGARRGAAQASAPAAAATTGAAAAAGPGATLLGPRRWSALRAFAERILPGAPGVPSAAHAGVMEYLDGALAGAYAPHAEAYREALDRLERIAGVTRAGESFDALPAARLDGALSELEKTAPAAFALLRQHVLEGYLADPAHGGNRAHAGWTALGLVRHEH